MVESWVRRLADGFWAAAGGPAPFPRDLEEATHWALPLAVQRIANLDLAKVQDWTEGGARANGSFRRANRRLHGALVAREDVGTIFLDPSDPPDEQRLSLAHEVAHYLADYQDPRDRVARRLGPDALAVLDHRRPPTDAERIAATLLDLTLAPHVHLLARGAEGDIDDATVYGAEWRAHRLGLELLAPADAVFDRVPGHPARQRGAALVRVLSELLEGEFGLPVAAARRYARDLAGSAGEPTAREWLGLDMPRA